MLNWSSAVIATMVVPPAGKLVGKALITRCVAGAAVTVIGLLDASETLAEVLS